MMSVDYDSIDRTIDDGVDELLDAVVAELARLGYSWSRSNTLADQQKIAMKAILHGLCGKIIMEWIETYGQAPTPGGCDG